MSCIAKSGHQLVNMDRLTVSRLHSVAVKDSHAPAD